MLWPSLLMPTSASVVARMETSQSGTFITRSSSGSSRDIQMVLLVLISLQRELDSGLGVSIILYDPGISGKADNFNSMTSLLKSFLWVTARQESGWQLGMYCFSHSFILSFLEHFKFNTFCFSQTTEWKVLM